MNCLMSHVSSTFQDLFFSALNDLGSKFHAPYQLSNQKNLTAFTGDVFPPLGIPRTAATIRVQKFGEVLQQVNLCRPGFLIFTHRPSATRSTMFINVQQFLVSCDAAHDRRKS